MATLFFESFNIQNPDGSLYLDNQYWTRPSGISTPSIGTCSNSLQNPAHLYGTQRHLRISGYYLDANPPQYPLPLQLSGISGLNSDQTYISFRVAGLTHNELHNNSFPYAAKFFTLCDGDNETLTFETVRITGESIQGIAWIQPSVAQTGLGISIKQSGTEIGLFDLRVQGLTQYEIWNAAEYYFPDVFNPRPNYPLGITTNTTSENRFIHLEFLIDRTTNIINLKLEGFDVLNRLTSYPYNYDASGNTLGNINNIKFFPKGITISSANTSCNVNRSDSYGLNGGSLSIDDLVIINNSGNNPNIWIGPKSRIINLFAPQYYGNDFNWNDYVGLNEWTSEPNNSDYYLSVRDGDSKYIYSETSGQIASFQPNAPRNSNFEFRDYYSNGIGGIRIYNDVRKTFLDSDFINVYGTGDIRNSGSYTNIGPVYTVNNTSYGIKNSFIFENPSTSSPWTSGTFFRTGNGFVQVSGFYGIKKL